MVVEMDLEQLVALGIVHAYYTHAQRSDKILAGGRRG